LNSIVGVMAESGAIAFCVVEVLQMGYVFVCRPYIAYLNNVQCLFGSMYRFGTLSIAIAMKEGISLLTAEQILLFWTTFMVAFFCIRENVRMYFDLQFDRSEWATEYSKLSEYDQDVSKLQEQIQYWENKEKHGYFEEEQIVKQLEEIAKAEAEKEAKRKLEIEKAQEEKAAISSSRYQSTIGEDEVAEKAENEDEEEIFDAKEGIVGDAPDTKIARESNDEEEAAALVETGVRRTDGGVDL